MEKQLTPVMPFGKYYGKRIGEIDDVAYLIEIKNQGKPRIRKAIGKQIHLLQTTPNQ